MRTTPPVTARWTSGAHDHLWTDAANWAPVAPQGSVIARFGRGDPLVDLAPVPGSDALLVGQIEVWGGSLQLADGVLHIKAPPYDRQFFADVALRIDDGGSLTIAADAKLLGMHTVALGDVSAATLDVQGTLSDAQVYVGRAGPVSITVEGSTARWNTSGIDQSFQLGGAGTVTMVIRDGGRVMDDPAWVNPNADSTMTIGGTTAGASVLVTDPGSKLRFQIIDVGGSYNGTLDIAAGAHVVDRGANIGEQGDGTVDVSGVGTAWNNLNGLFVHGTAPHGTVRVTDGAIVRFGEYGLQLGGDFAIDATSRLIGEVMVMAGGAFTGLASTGAAQSTVSVSQSIELAANPAAGGSNVGNFFGSAAGVTLVLDGPIAPQSSQYDPLAVGGGHVVLANPDNGDFVMALYGGVLELAVAGASGTGTISFVDTAGATLQVDQMGTLANPIAGFAQSGPDLIDLAAIAYGPPPSLSLRAGGGHAVLLHVSDGTHDVALQLGGGYRLTNFTTTSDGHGGTALGYHR